MLIHDLFVGTGVMSSEHFTKLMNYVTPNTTNAVYLSRVNWYYSARFWLSFGIAGFFANIVQFVSLIYQKKYTRAFGLTLLSLCIADTLGSLSFAICGTLRVIEYDGTLTLSIKPNTNLATTWLAGHAALFFSVGASFIHIVLVAVQRLFAVFLPLKFKRVFSYRRCRVLLLIVWTIFVGVGIYGYFDFQSIWYISYVLALTISLVLIISYTAIAVKTFLLSKHRKSLVANENGSSNSFRTMAISFGVTTAFLICFLPHAVFYLFVREADELSYYHTVNCIISINPFLDPLIYFSCDKLSMRLKKLTPSRCQIPLSQFKMGTPSSNRVAPYVEKEKYNKGKEIEEVGTPASNRVAPFLETGGCNKEKESKDIETPSSRNFPVLKTAKYNIENEIATGRSSPCVFEKTPAFIVQKI